MAEVDLNSNLPLFRPLRLFKSSNTYKLYGSKLSYTICREVFTCKNCLKDLGLDYKLYGLHSLRSGGASSVVSNSTSLQERLLKFHGRWKSDYAKDMYVLEDVSKSLVITDNLGLQLLWDINCNILSPNVHVLINASIMNLDVTSVFLTKFVTQHPCFSFSKTYRGRYACCFPAGEN